MAEDDDIIVDVYIANVARLIPEILGTGMFHMYDAAGDRRVVHILCLPLVE